MDTEQEKSFRNFQPEPPASIEPKDFISDVVVITEPETEDPAWSP